jgi:hypothetical protein
MLKIPEEYDTYTSLGNLSTFLAKFLPASLLGASAGICQKALVDESGMIRTQMGKHDKKMVAVHGTLCTIPPRNSKQ